MDTLFTYPESAAYGRSVPMSKILNQARLSKSLKEDFIQQVKQIVWKYKLAPETINLPQTSAVPEIQIFTIVLKEVELKREVLRCIDKAIPFPIIFELRSEKGIKIMASYKRPSESDPSKWIISDYFESDWMKADTIRKQLPMVLNLEDLYSELLSPLMPHPAKPGEGLQARVKRMEEIQEKKRELEKYEVHLRREKQFNRKVEINTQLRELKQQLINLTHPLVKLTN